MTRKSKRELERAVERFGGPGSGPDPDPLILHHHPETGVYRDVDGKVVDRDEVDPLIIIETEEP